MGLASALSTALTGMTAAETTIDVVGNNLANSNTVGFKASEAAFATQFLQTQGLGSQSSPNGSGGTNPRQIGLGSMVADITPNFTQGTVEISSSPTDLAIQGDGFFIVQGGNGEEYYTRNGILKMNAESELTTITGNRLLGYGVGSESSAGTQYQIDTTQLVPLSIPLGSAAVAKATENIYLEGTLSPTGDAATAAKIIETGVLGDGKITHPETIPVMNISGPPLVNGLSLSGVNDLTTPGAVPSGSYFYRLCFSDGAPNGTPPLEGTPSASTTVAVSVTNPGSNAVQISGLDALNHGTYSQVNFYRSTSASGPFTFVGAKDLSDPVTNTWTDTAAAGTTPLEQGFLNGQYEYYIAYGRSGGVPSRPCDKIGPFIPTDGRVHISDLKVPVDNPDSWDSWIVYRNAPSTPAGANRYFEVTTIPFGSGVTSFTDATPDTELYLDTTHHKGEIDLDGPKILPSTLLLNIRSRTGSNYDPVFKQEGTLNFTPQKGGRTLATKEFSVTATSTVGDLITFMEQTMGIQKPDSVNPIPESIDRIHNTVPPTYITPGGSVVGGRIRITGNNGVDNALAIGISGMKMSTAAGVSTLNMPYGTYQEAVGESAVADCIAYDSLGIPCQVRLTCVLESTSNTATTYRWFADSPSNVPVTGSSSIAVGTGLINFDGEGNFVSASNSTLTINRENVPSVSPLQMELDFTKLSGLAASKSSLAVSRQDGSAPGVLTSFIVGEEGLIRGVFSNGITRDLGQIVLARFSNPSGLQQRGQNLFSAGVNSGMPIKANPGQQGIGSIVAGATELSNTDIGANLIDLILASTMYRGNTRVITTAQQMLDELLALRR